MAYNNRAEMSEDAMAFVDQTPTGEMLEGEVQYRRSPGKFVRVVLALTFLVEACTPVKAATISPFETPATPNAGPMYDPTPTKEKAVPTMTATPAPTGVDRTPTKVSPTATKTKEPTPVVTPTKEYPPYPIVTDPNSEYLPKIISTDPEITSEEAVLRTIEGMVEHLVDMKKDETAKKVDGKKFAPYVLSSTGRAIQYQGPKGKDWKDYVLDPSIGDFFVKSEWMDPVRGFKREMILWVYVAATPDGYGYFVVDGSDNKIGLSNYYTRMRNNEPPVIFLYTQASCGAKDAYCLYHQAMEKGQTPSNAELGKQLVATGKFPKELEHRILDGAYQSSHTE